MSTLVSPQSVEFVVCVCVDVCGGLMSQEKSQLDWNRFKAEEGLEHELAQRRKDGSVL